MAEYTLFVERFYKRREFLTSNKLDFRHFFFFNKRQMHLHN